MSCGISGGKSVINLAKYDWARSSLFIRELKQRRFWATHVNRTCTSCTLNQILRQIVSIRVKTLSNTNLVGSRHIKREKGSLPVDVCRSETSLIKLPILFKRDDDFSLAKSTVRVSTSFSSLLLAARPYTVANCIQKSNNDLFDP